MKTHSEINRQGVFVMFHEDMSNECKNIHVIKNIANCCSMVPTLQLLNNNPLLPNEL
uniref:Uncharacterized protein n=1 Tax=Anguilla anguilla TaxID=7936 RepID=A0A0E9SHQ2_ANGAN